MNIFWTISHYLFKKTIFVYIDMVNVVLDLKCIKLKNTLETFNYNIVDHVT